MLLSRQVPSCYLPSDGSVEFEASGLARVIEAGYRLLGLLTFFTAGPNEVRAWTVRAGSTAPKAAGRIHTDFERGFIRAQVIAFEVDEHDVLRAFLRMPDQLGRQRAVRGGVRCARPGAGDRSCLGPAALDPQQSLGG